MKKSSSTSPSSHSTSSKQRKQYKELNVEPERCMYIWSMPANGHMNPTLCLTNEMLLKLDEMNIKKIVFYSGPKFKNLILNLPNNTDKKIEFREYNLYSSEELLMQIMNFDHRPGTLFRVFHVFENAVKLGARQIFKKLLADLNRDKPVLVLYDQALFFPKLALNLYAKRFKCQKPITASYVTTFLCARGIYPTWTEMNAMGLLGKNKSCKDKVTNAIITMSDFVKYLFTYYKTLLWDLGFNIFDLMYRVDAPLGRNNLIDEGLNLVFVVPQIQPRLEAFRSPNIKFVGPCVDEEVRSKILKSKFDVNMQKYSAMIEKFLEKNLIDNIEHEVASRVASGTLHMPNGDAVSIRSSLTMNESMNKNKNETMRTSMAFSESELDNMNSPPSVYTFLRSDSTGENFKRLHKPIIYVSMGTVFNNENSDLFVILVEACKAYADKYAIIVSTGDEKTYAKYANSELNSDNILLVPHTPQIEILKRAHLFITHAGMNSVSEAIHYGVPIICLPLSGDQPFVAWRMADELKMGKRLSPDDTLSIDQVKKAINEVLTDRIYRERTADLSVISRRYNGHKIGAEHLVDYFNKSELEREQALCLSRV